MSSSGRSNYGSSYGPPPDRREYAEARFGDGYGRPRHDREAILYDNVYAQPRRDREPARYDNSYGRPRRDHRVVSYDDSYLRGGREFAPYDRNFYGNYREPASYNDINYVRGSRRYSYGPEAGRHYGRGYEGYECERGYGREAARRHSGSYGGGSSGFPSVREPMYPFYDNRAGSSHRNTHPNYLPSHETAEIYPEGENHRSGFRSSRSVAPSARSSSRALPGDLAGIL